MRMLVILAALAIAGCEYAPPPPRTSLISPPCRPGEAGCAGAYEHYDHPARAPEQYTIQAGIPMLRQGEFVGCQ